VHRSPTPVLSLASTATRVVTVLGVAVMGITSLGCSSREAALVDHPVASVARGPACDVSRVEVWEDQLPPGRVIEVGRLRARTLSSDFSIQRMQERAAREGYDGIYWIDCASPGGQGSGDCSARAFVYSRTLAERTAARSGQVAAR
jgi:hypothetical protein